MQNKLRWAVLIGAIPVCLVIWWAMRAYAPCWLLDLYGRVPLYRLDECLAALQRAG